jgi:gluconate kinase
MPTVTLKAHYDGETIRLDEPFDLPPNTRLMVTVLPMTDDDREDWSHTSAASLARAYGENEPEYSERDVRHR